MYHSRLKLRQAGQSLIEVIIAISVGILVVTALTIATIFSLRNAQFSKNSAQATQLAQEGIDRVRTGRDRNQCINGLTSPSVNSWDGNNSDPNCSVPAVPGSGSIWVYQITNTNSGCDNPPPTGNGGKCYFNVDPSGVLKTDFSGFDFVPTAIKPMPTIAESIPPTNPVFKRAVLLSDDPTNYTTQKTVTVIVQWSDFSGLHESKLTTVLRKL